MTMTDDKRSEIRRGYAPDRAERVAAARRPTAQTDSETTTNPVRTSTKEAIKC